MPEREISSGDDESKIPSLETTEEPLFPVQEIMSQINTLQAGRRLDSLGVSELGGIRDRYLKLKKVLGLEQETDKGLVLQAKNEKGEPIEFNFEQIKSKVVDFYRKNDLKELADEIETATISLTKEQQEAIVEMVEKEGFDSAWIFPGNEIAQKNLAKVKEGTEKTMDGLPSEEQYAEEGTYLYGEVASAFPGKIQNNNRPNKPYVLLYKSSQEADEETREPLKGLGDEEVDNSAENLRKYFEKRGIKGLTLQEYLVLQRVITESKKDGENPHPDTENWTWLLDSELAPGSSEPGRVLRADWGPGGRQVEVDSDAPDDSGSDVGARSSAIFEIL